jgi:hypothetical protein
MSTTNFIKIHRMFNLEKSLKESSKFIILIINIKNKSLVTLKSILQLSKGLFFKDFKNLYKK